MKLTHDKVYIKKYFYLKNKSFSYKIHLLCYQIFKITQLNL